MIGQHILAKLFIGVYRQPREVDRVFMFLDIAGSTTLARELGDLGVHAMISQFFFDIDAVVVEYELAGPGLFGAGIAADDEEAIAVHRDVGVGVAE